MSVKIFGNDYNLENLQDVEKLSDLIEESQVNSARMIAQTLLTAIVLSNCEKEAV